MRKKVFYTGKFCVDMTTLNLALLKAGCEIVNDIAEASLVLLGGSSINGQAVREARNKNIPVYDCLSASLEQICSFL